ncbi:MAG: SET domain-containing protein [Myxococcota bacterium]
MRGADFLVLADRDRRRKTVPSSMDSPALAPLATLASTLNTLAPEPVVGPSPVRVGLVPGKGRGVFAARPIDAGELIETAPVIIIPPEQTERILGSVLEFYVFDWWEDASGFAVALGTGSLYNHSYVPNVRYQKRFSDGLIEFRALRPVLEGEELVMNYNGTPDDRSPLWFPVAHEEADIPR